MPRLVSFSLLSTSLSLDYRPHLFPAMRSKYIDSRMRAQRSGSSAVLHIHHRTGSHSLNPSATILSTITWVKEICWTHSKDKAGADGAYVVIQLRQRRFERGYGQVQPARYLYCFRPYHISRLMHKQAAHASSLSSVPPARPTRDPLVRLFNRPVHILPRFTLAEKCARQLALLPDSDNPDLQDWAALEVAKLSRTVRGLGERSIAWRRA